MKIKMLDYILLLTYLILVAYGLSLCVPYKVWSWLGGSNSPFFRFGISEVHVNCYSSIILLFLSFVDMFVLRSVVFRLRYFVITVNIW